MLVQSEARITRYTHLFACVSEEESGFTVEVKLYNDGKPENTAWGEEIVDTFETASMLVAALAAEFSIATERVELDIRMHRSADGTRH
jgi:hypothetical protein